MRVVIPTYEDLTVWLKIIASPDVSIDMHFVSFLKLSNSIELEIENFSAEVVKTLLSTNALIELFRRSEVVTFILTPWTDVTYKVFVVFIAFSINRTINSLPQFP